MHLSLINLNNDIRKFVRIDKESDGLITFLWNRNLLMKPAFHEKEKKKNYCFY